MPTFADVTDSWSDFKKHLDRERYDAITSNVGRARYVVVKASRWNDRYDADKRFVSVTLTRLDRAIGHVLRLVRDTGVTIVGTRDDRPAIILEPGEHWIEFAMAALGIEDEEEYDQAMRVSRLGRRLLHDERELQSHLKQVKAEHKQEVADLEASLKAAERAKAMSSPVRLQQQLLEQIRLREAAEAEARQLRLERTVVP